jgi:hypothetical protein
LDDSPLALTAILLLLPASPQQRFRPKMFGVANAQGWMAAKTRFGLCQNAESAVLFGWLDQRVPISDAEQESLLKVSHPQD